MRFFASQHFGMPPTKARIALKRLTRLNDKDMVRPLGTSAFSEGIDRPGKRSSGARGRGTRTKSALTTKKEILAQPRIEMPAESVQASRFEKARSAQASALLEDYVELIDDLLQTSGEARPTDIARRFGVSHATAIKSIARLKREGLATSRAYRGVFLTPEGQGLAARVRARHRLVVDLLVAVGVPHHCAELDAEGIEHHVSDVALAAFARFLKQPT
jgi:DtxR family manganese transport transcriptional regulator